MGIKDKAAEWGVLIIKYKIVLINANDFWLARQAGECDVMLPPLGLMSLSAYLKRKLFNQVDITIWDYMNDIRSMDRLAAMIRQLNPVIIGIKGITVYQERFNQISTVVKACCPSAWVVGGGPLITADLAYGLQNSSCDVTIMGEGEQTLYELITYYISKTDYQQLDNIAYRRDGQIVANARSYHFLSTDQLPIPDYESICLEDYKKYLSYAYNKRLQGNLFTSRGCAYICSFCHNVFGKEFRPRTPSSVLAEMEFLYHMGVRDYYILDDNFSYDIERAKEILGLIRNHAGWAGRVRLYFVNGLDSRNMDEAFLDLLREAGCVYLGFAIETVAGHLQKVLKKPVDIGKIHALILYANKKGMIVNYWAMLGLPGESVQDAWELIRFMQALPPTAIPMLFKLNAYPGSAIYYEANEEEREMLNYHDFTPLIQRDREYLKILQSWEAGILSQERMVQVTHTLRKNGYSEDDITAAYQLLYRSFSQSDIRALIKKIKCS